MASPALGHPSDAAAGGLAPPPTKPFSSHACSPRGPRYSPISPPQSRATQPNRVRALAGTHAAFVFHCLFFLSFKAISVSPLKGLILANFGEQQCGEKGAEHERAVNLCSGCAAVRLVERVPRERRMLPSSLGSFYALALLLLPVLVWLARLVRRKPYLDVFFGVMRLTRYIDTRQGGYLFIYFFFFRSVLRLAWEFVLLVRVAAEKAAFGLSRPMVTVATWKVLRITRARLIFVWIMWKRWKN